MPTAIATTIELPLVPFLHGKARLVTNLKGVFFPVFCVILGMYMVLLAMIVTGDGIDASSLARLICGAGVIIFSVLHVLYIRSIYYTATDDDTVYDWINEANKPEGAVGSMEAAWKSATWKLYRYELLADDTVRILSDFEGQVVELILPANRVEYHFGERESMRVTRTQNSLPDRYNVDFKDFMPKYERGEHETAEIWVTGVSLMVTAIELALPALF